MKIQKYGKANILTRVSRGLRKPKGWGTCGEIADPNWDNNSEEMWIWLNYK